MNYKLKNAIKNSLAQHSYGNAKFYEFLGRKKRERLLQLIKEMRQWDLLEDTSLLEKFRQKVGQQEEIFNTTDANWSNGHIYGIWQSIFGEYRSNIYRTPAVEHGLIFHQDIFTDLRGTGRMTFVSFSPFRKEIIQQKLARPTFCVGPYIHYCSPFYSEKRMRELKKELGKTLLVFPTHSTDTSSLSTDQERYLQEIKEIAKDYDSVLVNVFWWNINDPLTEAFRQAGYRVVSCGFRDDPMFLPRLKSYILLADLAVGDSIGTHVGYCVACGVPFSYRDIGTSVTLLTPEETKDLSFHQAQIEKIKNVFYQSTDINDAQKEMVSYYWGWGQEKTKEEILLIQEITEEIFQKSKGFTRNSYRVAQQLLSQYEKENPQKYHLLKEAL